MFLQVIEGRVDDAQRLVALSESWVEKLAPAAYGWLGSTMGVTDDGTGIVVARFESADAARRNSERPEQGEWWSEAEQAFSGPVTFRDFDGATLVRDGSPDGAGFVQVMLGRTSDPTRLREMMHDFDRMPTSFRPDVLGGVVAVNDDGQFAQAFYFTTEEEARRGEQEDMPEEMRAEFEEEQSLTQEIRYLDLRAPWHRSAS